MARTLAALLGTMPVALALGVALALALPLPLSARTLVGGYAVFPLWATLACALFLARSGRRAWTVLAALLLAAIAIAWLATRLRHGLPPTGAAA